MKIETERQGDEPEYELLWRQAENDLLIALDFIEKLKYLYSISEGNLDLDIIEKANEFLNQFNGK